MLAVPREEEGRVEDEFQRLRVQESAEERGPGREMCGEEAEAVVGMVDGDNCDVEVLLVSELLVLVLVARVSM